MSVIYNFLIKILRIIFIIIVLFQFFIFIFVAEKFFVLNRQIVDDICIKQRVMQDIYDIYQCGLFGKRILEQVDDWSISGNYIYGAYYTKANKTHFYYVHVPSNKTYYFASLEELNQALRVLSLPNYNMSTANSVVDLVYK